ncbi:MAG: amidohydrolase family protein [Deltaproteobacteria bacterium]|jgi:beta-aspartyl-dipeptidase (metallo-type)|nr:amidohydrolase family protein [Deltaproteobacteria bacterium]
MFKLIRGGKVFSPDNLGIKDILIVNDTILVVDDRVVPEAIPWNMEIYDASGKMILPGIVDSHVHIIGAGGAGGLNSRNKEIDIEQIIEAGVTTVVGCLGFDRTSRTLKNLLLKARALEELGLTAYILSGSYSLPPLTLTGSIEEDLILIDKVIGVKLALGEILANWPDERDIKNLLAECLRGGHLGEKPGFLQIHLGANGKVWKKTFLEILQETQVPFSRVIFTHANRSLDTFKEFADYVREGGYIDLTTSYTPAERPGSLSVLECMERLVSGNFPLDHVTLSSDSNATRILPDKRLKYLPVKTIFEVTRELCQSGVVPMEKAISLVTRNAANAIGCGKKKGSLAVGKDADLIILNEVFELEAVLIKGKWAQKKGIPLIKDPF